MVKGPPLIAPYWAPKATLTTSPALPVTSHEIVYELPSYTAPLWSCVQFVTVGATGAAGTTTVVELELLDEVDVLVDVLVDVVGGVGGVGAVGGVGVDGGVLLQLPPTLIVPLLLPLTITTFPQTLTTQAFSSGL